MILAVDTEYVSTCDKPWLAEIAITALSHRHYILCDRQARQTIVDAVNTHGSTLGKEIFKLGDRQFFQPTKLQCKFLTTIPLDGKSFSQQEYLTILREPSKLLMEDAIYEWPIYKCFAGNYSGDEDYGSLFIQLHDAMAANRLTYLHGGGCSRHIMHIEGEIARLGSEKVTHKKLCVLIDRDDMSRNETLNTRIKLYNYLTGRDDSAIDESLIYTLEQKPYVWHMWQKYSIDNYFPDHVYYRHGFDTTKFPTSQPDRDSHKLENYMTPSDQRRVKSELQEMAGSMGRGDIEPLLHTYGTHVGNVSEMQMFLLKLVKFI